MKSAQTRADLSGSGISPEPVQVSAAGRRRSGRISKEVSIVLSGSDTEGRQFSESTETLVLSRHGASVLSRHKLIPEQETFLFAVEAKREVEVRICGEIGKGEDGHIYGVAFVDPSVNFWEIEFPPVAEDLEKELTRVTLECTGCRQRAVVQFDATEMDVYTVNEGTLRYCKRCLNSTNWKITTDEDANDARPQQGAKPEMALGTRPSAMLPPNRRKERRTKVKFNACIRSSGVIDEIVACEDMSRGGFSFRSSRQYSEETMIGGRDPNSLGDADLAGMRPV
jgi:hypothetical protein